MLHSVLAHPQHRPIIAYVFTGAQNLLAHPSGGSFHNGPQPSLVRGQEPLDHRPLNRAQGLYCPHKRTALGRDVIGVGGSAISLTASPCGDSADSEISGVKRLRARQGSPQRSDGQFRRRGLPLRRLARCWRSQLSSIGLQASILAFTLARSNSNSRSFCLMMKASDSLPSSGMGTVYSTSTVSFVPPSSG